MPAQPEIRHPLFSRFYVWTSAGMEEAGVGDHREKLLAGLTGSVIEVGAGNGLNFSHYPVTVTSVLAVEPEAHLRALAAEKAGQAKVAITVVDGTAEDLPAADGAFDAVVATLMLCSVRDVAVVLAEMKRVLKPGGELRFMEHVLAEQRGAQRMQRLLDATIWPRMFGGCHTSRDAAAQITAAGFDITDVSRYQFPETRLFIPTSPHVQGVAVRT
jgi:ubiquinone/menaquinone biosynthesis C-methylase UbiE